MVIPPVIEIENVHGYCNADCNMCSINNSKLKPNIMSTKDFKIILNKFIPYLNIITNLDIVGLGESLIDKELTLKIEYAKKCDFKNICISTNVSFFNNEKSKEILESGLDAIIFSIDSLKKKTYEKIRQNLCFENVISKAHNFIKLRNTGKYKTKIFIRIIEQSSNSDEWIDYCSYWSRYLNLDDGDMILRFPVHNWADSPNIITGSEKNIICPYIFDRIVINSKGDIQFCCIDIDADFYKIGDVFHNDPIEIFNNDIFSEARGLMNAGKIETLKKCKNCDVPFRRMDRGYYKKLNQHLVTS